MKFRYLGEGEMSVFGHCFSNGATPDVTEERYIAKLSGNSDFEAVKENSKKTAIPVDTPVQTVIIPVVNQDDKKDWPV